MRPALVDGCFDPFHPGHVAYLQAAREIAGPRKLVAKIATDDEVAYKHVPLFSQEARGQLVQPFVDVVLTSDEPIPEIIRALSPGLYLKGSDWDGRLPESHLDACDDVDCEVMFTNTSMMSSSQQLADWQCRSDLTFLRRFEKIAATQDQPQFGETYWRTQGFTYDERVAIEGRHPDVFINTFPGCTVLDYGCGQGHFVRMLQDRHVTVVGYDPHTGDGSKPPRADVVVCREVLEHVPVREYGDVLDDLIALSKRYIYLTARFHECPMNGLDVQTRDGLDYTHISRVNQAWLRSYFTIHCMARRRDLELAMDHQQQGRVFVYEHSD